MRTTRFPLPRGSFRDENRPFSMQDMVNLRYQASESEGTRSPEKLQTLPGLKPFVEVDTAGVCRGAHNAEGKLLSVMGRTLYRVSKAGVAIPLGTLPGAGRVQMDHNQISLGNEVMVVNGSAGYTWNSVSDEFARITDDGFPGGSVLRFLSGRMVGIEPQGRFAYNSEPADARSYNTLDRWTSEVTPDRLVSMGVRGEELLLLSVNSGEFFQATANARQPFRTKRISFRGVGAAGPHCSIEADGNVWWLGSDGVFYALNSYSPIRISDDALEAAISGYTLSNAFAFRWDTVVYWTFPDGITVGYDFKQRQWHRRLSPGLNRWRVNAMARWNGRWIAGDFQANRLWDCNLEDDYWLEGSDEYITRFSMAVMANDQNPLRLPRLEIVMDRGQPETEPVAFPGQPEGPTIIGNPPGGFVGQAYSTTFTATGGTPPYTHSHRSGTLPPGLEQDNDGELAGTLTTAGTYSDNVWRVTDANGLWDEMTAEIVVEPAIEAAWFYGPVYENGAAGGSEAFYLRTFDPTDWSGEPIPLPEGLTSLGRISVANGRLFFHSASTIENAQVSADFGHTWTECDHPLLIAGNEQFDVYWNGNYYYWHGLRSSDGVAWTTVPNLPAAQIGSWLARESDGLYLVYTIDGNIHTTLDDAATAFTERTDPLGGPSVFIPFTTDGERIIGGGATGLCYSDNLFATAATLIPDGGHTQKYLDGVWGGFNGDNIKRSTTGATFDDVQPIAIVQLFLRLMDASPDVWAFVELEVGADEAPIWTSTDGALTWTEGETLHGPGGYLAFVGT